MFYQKNGDIYIRRLNMLSLSQLQSFIGEVSNMVNSKDNPLGLSPGQVDEINQIMNCLLYTSDAADE